MLPNLELLEQIQQGIKTIPNQKGEYLRKIHYGCYLLGLKSGLRISEAIRFNLSQKTEKGLYRITKTKGNKTRYAYISPKTVRELKKIGWQPNQNNRWNFYHFLRKIKRELNISKNIELTPHTLRRAFATYHAESGLPLPLLQKLLGHKSIRTTALYWRNIYSEDDDSSDILTVKTWLNNPKKPKPIPENPVQISLEKLPELIIPNSLASEPLSNYLGKVKDLGEQLDQVRAENSSLKTELNQIQEQKTNLHQAKNQAISENHQLQQNLTQSRETIQQLTQELVGEQSKRVQAESNLNQEKANSTKQKQTITDLSQELQAERKTITDLNTKLTQQEQNYQKAIKNKTEVEKLIQAEKQNTLIQKQRADYYENQLKTIAKSLYQWQKQNHYQQLEQQQSEIQTQIIQPPPWKYK